ncbi:MAG TPA: DUF6789 family protein [Vicinamibacterales bacterium]|nr:DUF6789 family protein [Vicinamibacterales bacterium]
MRQLINGSIAGLIATVPMSATMAALHGKLPKEEQYSLPPLEITVAVANGVGAHEVTDGEEEREAATWVSHFGYGAATGAIYGTIADSTPLSPLAGGVLWGLVVWSGSYLGWLPLAGLRAPATRQPPRREALMIAAHVVFGAATGLIYEALRRAERRGSRTRLR